VQAMYERVWTGGECDTCRLREDCPGPLIELARSPPAPRKRSRRARLRTL
jgi:hypothetical protein